MDSQIKFLLAALLFLIPIGVILFQWVFFVIGDLFWRFLLPKLKRTSKLRIKIIEFKYRNGPDLIYVLTGIVITYLFFGLIALFI